MKVTLKKAHALAQMALDAARNLPILGQINVSVFSPSTVVDEVDAARSALKTNLGNALVLTEAAYEIRAQIAKVNAVNNIDVLLNEKAVLDAKEKLLTAVVNSGLNSRYGDDADEISVAQNRLESLRNQKSDTYNHRDYVTVSVVTTMNEELKKELLAIRKRKQAITDELQTINFSDKIVLTEATVQLFKVHDLI